MSRWSAYRFSAHAAAAAGAVFVALVVSSVLLAGPSSAHPGVSAKVSPDRGLVNGQVVTVSGRGFSRAAVKDGVTWFVTECTSAVHVRVNPSTDTAHCDVTAARAIRVGRDGSFSTKFRVRTGIVGDGYCGTVDHPRCVIGVSNAKGQGTVVKITFATGTKRTTSTTTRVSARRRAASPDDRIR